MDENKEANDLIQNLMDSLRTELNQIKTEISNDIRKEIADIRTELRNELDELKTEVKTDNATKKQEADEPDPRPFGSGEPGDEASFVPPMKDFHFPPKIDIPHMDWDFDFHDDEESKTYDFKDFTGVHIGGTFKAKIMKGDEFKIAINASDKLFKNIDVSKHGDTLRVEHSRHLGWKAALSRPEAIITLPLLKELRVFGATSVTISGFESDENFKLDMSGASSLQGDIIAPNIDLDISGASYLKLSGSAKDAIVKSSGANNTDLADFTMEHMAVKVSGASNLAAHVTGKLDARISGTANFKWKGNPVMGDIRTSGLASMHKI